METVTWTLVLQDHVCPVVLKKQMLKISKCIKTWGLGPKSFNMHVKDRETLPNKSPAMEAESTS